MRSKVFFMLMALFFLAENPARAILIDRIVAFVGDYAILASELTEAYEKAKAVSPDITKKEVLETLINRKLLLLEAKKLFPETTDEDTLMKDYMDLRIRAFIKIPEQEIQAFYEQNKARFGGVPYEEVKDRIEVLLQEKEVNRRLASHIQDLRAATYIRTFPED